MKYLVLVFVAWLASIVALGASAAQVPPAVGAEVGAAFCAGAMGEADDDTTRPSASIALLTALDLVLEDAPESGIEVLGANSRVIEATKAKAAHVVVELDLLVHAEGGAKAESGFRFLEKSLAKRAGLQRTDPFGYGLFERTLPHLASRPTSVSLHRTRGWGSGTSRSGTPQRP